MQIFIKSAKDTKCSFPLPKQAVDNDVEEEEWMKKKKMKNSTRNKQLKGTQLGGSLKQ